jgi:hypothetical protein
MPRNSKWCTRIFFRFSCIYHSDACYIPPILHDLIIRIHFETKFSDKYFDLRSHLYQRHKLRYCTVYTRHLAAGLVRGRRRVRSARRILVCICLFQLNEQKSLFLLMTPKHFSLVQPDSSKIFPETRNTNYNKFFLPDMKIAYVR